MYKPRKLGKEGANEKRLLQALREIHEDGVRVCKGQSKKQRELKQRVEAELARQVSDSPFGFTLEGEPVGSNPYDHTPKR